MCFCVSVHIRVHMKVINTLLHKRLLFLPQCYTVSIQETKSEQHVSRATAAALGGPSISTLEAHIRVVVLKALRAPNAQSL